MGTTYFIPLSGCPRVPHLAYADDILISRVETKDQSRSCWLSSRIIRATLASGWAGKSRLFFFLPISLQIELARFRRPWAFSCTIPRLPIWDALSWWRGETLICSMTFWRRFVIELTGGTTKFYHKEVNLFYLNRCLPSSLSTVWQLATAKVCAESNWEQVDGFFWGLRTGFINAHGYVGRAWQGLETRAGWRSTASRSSWCSHGGGLLWFFPHMA